MKSVVCLFCYHKIIKHINYKVNVQQLLGIDFEL